MSEKQIAVLLLNRPQNLSIISVCNAQHYNCQDVSDPLIDTSTFHYVTSLSSETFILA